MVRTIGVLIISIALVAMMGGAVLAEEPAKSELGTIYGYNDSLLTHENLEMVYEDPGILPGLYDTWYGTGPVPDGAMRTKGGVILVPIPAGTPTSGIIQSDGSVIPF